MQRRIGDVSVFPIGLGCMGLSDPKNLDNPERGLAAVHAALDAGIQVLDTANIYAPSWDQMGHNEHVVGQALSTWVGDRSRALLVTKGGITRGPGESWGRDGSAAGLMNAARTSARALGVDSIDLYLIHRFDPDVHLNDQIEALVAIKEAGVARRIGLSNVLPSQLERALSLGAPIAAVQNEFSLRYRRDPEVIDICRDTGIAFMTWSPLGGASTGSDTTGRYAVVSTIAAELGVTPAQVTLAWLMSLAPVVLPIPGASRPENAAANAAAARIDLSSEQVEAISRTVSEMSSVFPDDGPQPPM